MRLTLNAYFLLSLLTLILPSTNSPEAGRTSRRVLLLYSDEKDLPMNLLIDRQLRSSFRAQLSEEVELYSEYVDVSRFPDENYPRKLLEFLHDKYSARGLDLIVVVGASALDQVQLHRDWFFPVTPVVFCCVTEAEYKVRTIGSGITGIPVKLDYAPTIEVALKLHPTTRRVVVISGAAASDAQIASDARRDYRPFEGHVEFCYLAGLPMADLRREVSALSGDTIIIHLSIYQDGAGKSYIPRDALSQVAQAASVPIYGYYDSYFGTGGIIGGFLTSFEIEASNATRLGLRILGGEKPEEVSTAGANSCAYMFDWRELKRWGISDASLPPGSIVRSRSPGFWDLYRWHVITVICIGAIEVVLILALLVQRARRRRAEKERQQADEQFRLVVECTPSSMVMATASGTVVLVNGQVEKSFGYCREELVGRRVEILLPERFRSKHPKHRAGFVFSPAFRGPAPLPLPVLTAVGPSAAFIGRPRTKHECSSIFLMAKFNRGSWSMENPQAGANQ